MFSVPRFPNRSLCFGLERRNDRTLASDRGPYANRIPRTSNRSGCFDLKRRSNRTQASIRGSYGNRGCAAREICDDEEACEVHSDDASGGHLSFCATKRKMEKKKRQRKPIPRRFPLESFPDGQGRNRAAVSPIGSSFPGKGGGREFCTEQRDKVTCAGMRPPAGWIDRIPASVRRRAP